MKDGIDLTGAAEIVPDTRCVFNFVSSDVNMVWKRSVVPPGWRGLKGKVFDNVV